jgi:DNA-binding NarL/FixJ family response regulator
VSIGVVIADDQALLRGGFRVLIDSAPDMRVLGEAADGEAAVAITEEQEPDVVLMDIRMPGVDGIDATRRIKNDERTAKTKVLILTTFDLDEYVYAALRAGASGFMLKDTSPEELLAGIRVVAAGDALLSPSVTRRLIELYASRPAPVLASPALLDQLTEREREVLVEVAHGLTNKEIGEKLHMSAATAKTHVGHLFSKLNARDRAQLVVIGYESGIVQPG